MAASGDVLVSIGKDLILCTWSIRTKVTCTGGDFEEDDSLHEGILLLYIQSQEFIENKHNGFVWELKGQIDLSDLRHGT